MNFREFVETDTTMQQGDNFFWGDDSARGPVVAAGVLPIAADTGRICLLHRSNEVNNWIDGKSIDVGLRRGMHHLSDPVFRQMYMQGCYGTFGGGLGGRSPEEAAKEEAYEETGYSGPWVHFEKSLMWRVPGMDKAYQNFLGIIPREKGFHYEPTSGSSWESEGIQWVELEEVAGKNQYNGIRFHDGLRDLLSSQKGRIEQLIKSTSATRVLRPKKSNSTSQTGNDQPVEGDDTKS